MQKSMEKNKVADRKSPRPLMTRIARTLKVCGHPIRLKLLRVIESSEPCVSDLWHCVEESQPVVSQHLAVLKREGIVASRVEGNRRIYSVTDAWVKELIRRIP
jgi:DNA-binding transcriptional ArsR family regulator